MGNCFSSRSSSKNGTLSGEPVLGSRALLSGNSHPQFPLKSENSERKCVPITLPATSVEGDIFSPPNMRAFKLMELKNATRNFHKHNLLGDGGFGYVFKGLMSETIPGSAASEGETFVAVKKLKPGGFQGHKEWLSEVNHLGRLHHPNLVKLLGYCLEGENRLLVYEYMPGSSLEYHLFKREAPSLSWATRMKIAIGAARGLCFLHQSKESVIYRDFKPSNVLLDLEFNAKLSDFGLAKEGPTGDRTHVTTEVLGTQGYAAPEYLATGRLTAKCDVYSFGVVLLELLSGRRAIDKSRSREEQHLEEWASPYIREKRKLYRIMDTRLEGQYPRRGAFMVALVALQCIGDVKVRPAMAEVLAVLGQVPVSRRDRSNRSHHANSRNALKPTGTTPAALELPQPKIDCPSLKSIAPA